MVKPSGRPEKQRQLFRYSGLGDSCILGVHNNSLANLRRGMIERVYYVEGPSGLVAPPQPLPNHFKNTLSGFSRLFCTAAGRHTPITREQFLMYYRGRKLAVYQKAVDSLSENPLTPRDARLKTFVKAEKINLSKKPDPAPRVIQPRSPRYNVELGVYLRPFEHRAFKAVAEVFGEPTVFKGYNMEQQGRLMRDKWDMYYEPVAIGLDASRFDQHVSVSALEWEHSLYHRVFNHDRKLKKLLKWQINNEGVGFASDGMLKYTKKGCRMSGDMNTSLGNCLIMCAMVHELGRSLGIRLSLANNGDDCVIICERSDEVEIINHAPNFFLNYGFTMCIEKPVYEFEQIEFCQTHPVYDGSGYIMVRNPKVALTKDLTCLLPLQSVKNFKEWLTSVSMCGISLTGGIPIWQSFYRCLNSGSTLTKFTGTGHFVESGLAYHAKSMSRKICQITPEARVSFWKAYNITPDLQVALEDWYDTISLTISEPSPCDTRQRSSSEIIDGIPNPVS